MPLDLLEEATADNSEAEPASEPRQKNGWLARADGLLSPIIKIFAVIAVLAGALEYFQHVQDNRIERSLAEVENWDGGGYRAAYGELNAIIWPFYQQQAEFIADLRPDQQALIYANIGERVTGQDDQFDAQADRLVDDLFYFFDRIALCAHQRICDFDVLNAFLGTEVIDFWRYFSEYAERRRDAGYGNYGLWTERFAKAEIARASWLLGF